MFARIKFELDDLVNQIVNEIPSDIWESKNTKFLDPDMSGGQFVKAIEQKLKDYNHSSKNISKRVFGREKYEHRVNYAVNKYNLLGNYKVSDYFNEDFSNMNVTVMVGNPPYNDGSSARNPIYHLFLEDAVKKNPEFFVMIIQANWFTQPDKKLGKSVRDSLKKLGLYKIVINPYDTFDRAKVKTCTVFARRGYTGPVKLIDDVKNSIDLENINSTILYTANKIELDILNKLRPEKPFWSTYSGGKGNTNSWRIMTSYQKENFEISPMNQLKIYEPNYASQTGYRVFAELPSKIAAEEALIWYKSFWHSKLITWIMQRTRTSTTLDNPQISWVPGITIDHKFTDEELYHYFNLTKSQIDYIEKTIR